MQKKEEWKTCQFFVNYTFHDSSTFLLKHKIPLQHCSKNIWKKNESKLWRSKSQDWNNKRREIFFYVKWRFIHYSSVVSPSLLDHFHKTSLGIPFYHWEYTKPLAAISQILLRSHQGEWLAACVEGWECFFWLWCFLQGGGNSSAATFLVYSLSSLPWGGRVTYLMVNMKGITGYNRLKSDFILLGSELSTGSTIS